MVSGITPCARECKWIVYFGETPYRVWTVLHNFDCRAPDGTTPASRFFRRSFPDLFETVFSQVGDLPRPRNRNQAMALSD
jgi:Family of unknown function (DUF6399)